MIYSAKLGTYEGDSMEVQFEYIPTWGPDGIKGYYMAGRVSHHTYASNIGVIVKLSDQRVFPVKIFAELSAFVVPVFNTMVPPEAYTPTLVQQHYELENKGEGAYICKTNNRIEMSNVTGSELREETIDQYVKFTLLYDDFSTVPLFCPINRTPVFRINLCMAKKYCI